MTDNPILGERFDVALAMASALHRRQERKGTRIPYVSHLMAVTAIVLEHGGGEDEAIAALLHDAVEDQGGSATLQTIRERFGDGVAGLVEELSDTDGDSKAGAADWRARKERYLRHLETASDSARLVSAADKLHNLRALVADLQREGEGVWGRFNAGREDIVWYYREIVGCVRRGGPQSLAAPLGEALRDLEGFEVRAGLAKAIAIAARVHLL
jgi:(p)ppGpp synthase/HD superfamily hydrolase